MLHVALRRPRDDEEPHRQWPVRAPSPPFRARRAARLPVADRPRRWRSCSDTTPGAVDGCVALDDIELDGVRILKGAIAPSSCSARRTDPRSSPTDRLDFRRTDIRHISFGLSVHYCAGSALARMETQATISTFLRRFPDAEPLPGPLTWRMNPGMRGLTAIPTELGPQSSLFPTPLSNSIPSLSTPPVPTWSRRRGGRGVRGRGGGAPRIRAPLRSAASPPRSSSPVQPAIAHHKARVRGKGPLAPARPLPSPRAAVARPGSAVEPHPRRQPLRRAPPPPPAPRPDTRSSPPRNTRLAGGSRCSGPHRTARRSTPLSAVSSS